MTTGGPVIAASPGELLVVRQDPFSEAIFPVQPCQSKDEARAFIAQATVNQGPFDDTYGVLDDSGEPISLN